MANYTVDKVKYGSNVYILKDSNALPLTGGSVTGPVIFGDAVTADSISTGDLVVTGSASFANNLQAVTINGVTVGSSPKFTDTVTTATTSGSGNAVTAISASNGALTVTKGSTFLTSADISGKIDTAGTGLSKSGTTLNHSNSVTAQTTQNVYPIKIDAQGHISAYGTAITSAAAASGGTTVSLVTTGEKYTWNNKGSGTVTKVSTGAGLTGGDITTTGTIAHSNSVTAQTTQAVYPIKIDAQGHISAYGSAATLGEVNQNAFSNVKVGETTIAATAKTDTLELVAGTNVTLTPDSTNKTVTITGEAGGRTTFYGTCSTTASTAAKAVTATGFTFDAGNILCVNFTTANTAATPKLNVNSAGAKTIYIGSTTALSSTANVLKWSANTLVYFMYDGTYFRYITSVSAGSVAPSRGAGTWYGTSSTAAGTTAKTSSIDNYVLTKGAVATITFSTANTVATPTLNINSTGAKTIYNANGSTSATNPFYWGANTTITFVYSGSYYYVLSYHTKVNHVDDVEYLDLARELATAYSASSTYYVGQFCTYDSNVYECNTAITTAESWTSGHWTLIGAV